eukprot:86971-Chlamydomonas_euryale.AAC.1
MLADATSPAPAPAPAPALGAAKGAWQGSSHTWFPHTSGRPHTAPHANGAASAHRSVSVTCPPTHRTCTGAPQGGHADMTAPPPTAAAAAAADAAASAAAVADGTMSASASAAAPRMRACAWLDGSPCLDPGPPSSAPSADADGAAGRSNAGTCGRGGSWQRPASHTCPHGSVAPHGSSHGGHGP